MSRPANDGLWHLEAARIEYEKSLARISELEAERDAAVANGDLRYENGARNQRLVDEARIREIEAEFKNFHRVLCERFGYSHDPIDWKRDQCSLIEHIAGLTSETNTPCFQAESIHIGDDVHRKGSEMETPLEAAFAKEPERSIIDAALRSIGSTPETPVEANDYPVGEGPIEVTALNRQEKP